MVNGIKHLLCANESFVQLLEKCPFRSFAQFLIELFVFLPCLLIWLGQDADMLTGDEQIWKEVQESLKKIEELKAHWSILLSVGELDVGIAFLLFGVWC